MTITVLGETYSVTKAVGERFLAYVAQGLDELTAIRAATGEFEDIEVVE